jgi:hypothetical protein
VWRLRCRHVAVAPDGPELGAGAGSVARREWPPADPYTARPVMIEGGNDDVFREDESSGKHVSLWGIYIVRHEAAVHGPTTEPHSCGLGAPAGTEIDDSTRESPQFGHVPTRRRSLDAARTDANIPLAAATEPRSVEIKRLGVPWGLYPGPHRSRRQGGGIHRLPVSLTAPALAIPSSTAARRICASLQV